MIMSVTPRVIRRMPHLQIGKAPAVSTAILLQAVSDVICLSIFVNRRDFVDVKSLKAW
jgi:hypothetical protein